MTTALALIAAAVTSRWAIAHLLPTRSVVESLGDIGTEDERVITIEWIGRPPGSSASFGAVRRPALGTVVRRISPRRSDAPQPSAGQALT